MSNSIASLLIGGGIALVSTIVGIIVQHIFEIKKLSIQQKLYPSTILYNKQIEFMEKTFQIFGDLYEVIVAIRITLNLKDELRKKESVFKTKVRTQSDLLTELVFKNYYYFLPSDIIYALNDLANSCYDLAGNISDENNDRCEKELRAVHDIFRKFVGVNELSEDLIASFAMGKKKKVRIQ